MIKATHEFEVRAKLIAGEENRLAEYLSRWHIIADLEIPS
jgi:hypothetical protein